MGNLYIVSTPIGNLQDITIRAAKIILESEHLIAESASKTGILLTFLRKQFPNFADRPKEIISLPQESEELLIPKIIKILEEDDIALISEAGTPLISDPGFKLIREAIKRGIRIIPIPGASAVIAAISASGFPTDDFRFIGFLPKGKTKKEKKLEKIKNEETTIVLFESPHRLKETIEAINNVFGNIDLVIAREITKLHEEFIRSKAVQILDTLEDKTFKGEITIIFPAKS